MDRRKIGNIYEEKAKKFLEAKGLKYIDRNVFGRFGEIDLVFLDGKILVFIEVKYRKNSTFGYGSESVTDRKKKRIYLTAMEYLGRKKSLDCEVRFDLISFYGEDITWTRNIIWGDNFGF